MGKASCPAFLFCVRQGTNLGSPNPPTGTGPKAADGKWRPAAAPHFGAHDVVMRSALAFDLLARSARQEGRARKSACSGCLVDCCEQAGVEREVCLGRPARIEDERYDRESGALCKRRRHFGIGAQCLDRARLRCFSAAACSENDQGSMNLASNTAPLPATMPSRVPPIHRRTGCRSRYWTHSTVCPVLRSNQCRLRASVNEPELDDEVAGQVLRLGLAPFLAPQAHQGGFIVAHDDAGVGAADEAAPADGLAKSYFNGCRLHPSLFNHHRCLLNSCSRVIINQLPAVVNSDRIGEISSPYD